MLRLAMKFDESFFTHFGLRSSALVYRPHSHFHTYTHEFCKCFEFLAVWPKWQKQLQYITQTNQTITTSWPEICRQPSLTGKPINCNTHSSSVSQNQWVQVLTTKSTAWLDVQMADSSSLYSRCCCCCTTSAFDFCSASRSHFPVNLECPGFVRARLFTWRMPFLTHKSSPQFQWGRQIKLSGHDDSCINIVYHHQFPLNVITSHVMKVNNWRYVAEHTQADKKA